MFFKAHKNQTVCYRNNIRSFQKKKHRADWFRGGKILQGNTRRKNILHWKNNLSWRIMLEKHLKPLYVEKKILSPQFWKKDLTQTEFPPPSPKRQTVGPMLPSPKSCVSKRNVSKACSQFFPRVRSTFWHSSMHWIIVGAKMTCLFLHKNIFRISSVANQN